jgi:hypothetical protein
MLRGIQQILRSLQNGGFKLLIFAGVLLLGWGITAPVGTIVWWLNQGAESLGVKRHQLARSSTNLATSPQTSSKINCYLVFLAGVGDFSANQLTVGEEQFLQRLTQQHPNCVAVRDVFPYSVANKDLGGERLLAPLWRFADQAEGWLSVANGFIKIRNLWRFAISADDRYGIVYSQGIADAILERMNAAHPISRDRQRPLKVILLGTSGGVQVALGAATYLHQWLEDPELIVVSAGGVFDGEKGFDAIDQMYHLRGDQDAVEDISRIFASHWRWTVGSPFNRARQQGRFQVVNTGTHAHDGNQGYFGLATVQPNVTYLDQTLKTVNQLPIWSSQPPTPPAGSRYGS